MKKTQVLLVFGEDEGSQLIETLFQLDFLPLLRSELRSVLKLLRHHKFAALLVDRGHLHADALETVLNVRDVDGEIPIIVVGERTDASEEQALKKQLNTTCLNEPTRSDLRNLLTA